MARLIKTNPELFENETLGEAAPSRFLDEVELQLKEDTAARFEGRDALLVRRDIRYPTYMPSGSVPSDVQPSVSYIDPVLLTSPVAGISDV